jgi:uncharacterized repeat protein (TIGR03803 family)
MLIVGLLSLYGPQAVYAQPNTFNVLYTFPALPGAVNLPTTTNSVGGFAGAGLSLSNNTLFGTAVFGGILGGGTIFMVNTGGSDFTNLHNFPIGTNEGDQPTGSILLGNTLYGTTEVGGSGSHGTVFRISTDGSGFTNLHSFAPTTNFVYTNADGIQPLGGVIISGNTLYGTAEAGGKSGNGTVFRLITDGTGFTNLHSFALGNFDASQDNHYTNADGAGPYAGLILSGTTLYGTTEDGGMFGGGTVFRLNTDGSGFTNLQSLSLVDEYEQGGSYPSLVLSGNTLYGTAGEVSSGSAGAIFRLNTDGSDFTNIYVFTGGADGTQPHGLILSRDTLYGTATLGGSGGSGTLFAVNTNGANFTVLYSFTSAPASTNSDGANPRGGLTLSGNTLYGTANFGGIWGAGTVFSLTLLPPLSIALAGKQLAISWPAWATNFTLQTATDLASTTWSNITNGFTTSGTNYFFGTNVTNYAAYFRLRQQ